MMARVAIPSPEHVHAHLPAGSGLRAGLSVAFAARGVAPVILCAAGSLVAGGLLNVCEPLLATKVLHGSGSDYALLVACYGTAWSAPRCSSRAAAEHLPGCSSIAISTPSRSPPWHVRQRDRGQRRARDAGLRRDRVRERAAPCERTQIIQLRVPLPVQGRLFGAKDTLEGAAFLIGLLGAGALVAAAGVRVTLASGAAICGLCALVAVASVRLGAPAAATAPDASIVPLP